MSRTMTSTEKQVFQATIRKNGLRSTTFKIKIIIWGRKLIATISLNSRILFSRVTFSKRVVLLDSPENCAV